MELKINLQCSCPTLWSSGLSRQKVRRLEAEAAEQARVAGEGVAVLRLQMLDLFAKRTSISAAIEQAVKDLKG